MNIICCIWDFIRRHVYITVTILGILVVFLNDIYSVINIDYTDEFIGYIINISSILFGFLLTNLSVYLVIPKESRFMRRVQEVGHGKVIILTIAFGELLLLLSMISGVFGITSIILYFFIPGIINMIVCSGYIIKIAYLVSGK